MCTPFQYPHPNMRVVSVFVQSKASVLSFSGDLSCMCYVCAELYVNMCVFVQSKAYISSPILFTAILIIIKDLFQVIQRFSSSKVVLKAVESRFAAPSCYENGSI
jgi:hypothetical protein